jgi:hypothetical protein
MFYCGTPFCPCQPNQVEYPGITFDYALTSEQTDGTLNYYALRGVVGIATASLVKEDGEVQDNVFPVQHGVLPGENATGEVFALNGFYEGSAQNVRPPNAPYVVELTLTVSSGCGSHCGTVNYPEQGLRAPLMYDRAVDCFSEIIGTAGTGRCWYASQFNVFYTCNTNSPQSSLPSYLK